MLNNDWGMSKYPFVPGHEVTGTVSALGEQAKGLKTGQRVGLGWWSQSCLSCHECLSGDHHLCSSVQGTIVGRHGAFADRVRAQWTWVRPIPDGLDMATTGPLLCGGVTVFTPLLINNVRSTARVGIIGVGGLGHMGVLLARAMGGRAAVLSTSADKQDEARALGAERFINLKTESPSEALRAWEGGADIILATPPAAEPMMAAFPGLALNGTMVVLGAPPDSIAVNPMELIMGRRRLMGSPAGSRKDLRDVLHLASTHGLHPRVTTMPLDDAERALKKMHQKSIHGRAVLVMD